MNTAKVFWSGRSQAVRLPKASRLETHEVRIRRHGRSLILEPAARDRDWLEVRAGKVDVVEELQFGVVDVDQDDARQAGAIRAALAASGKQIGPCDVLIAGQAQARDLILITPDVRDLSRVTGLRIEDREA